MQFRPVNHRTRQISQPFLHKLISASVVFVFVSFMALSHQQRRYRLRFLFPCVASFALVRHNIVATDWEETKLMCYRSSKMAKDLNDEGQIVVFSQKVVFMWHYNILKNPSLKAILGIVSFNKQDDLQAFNKLQGVLLVEKNKKQNAFLPAWLMIHLGAGYLLSWEMLFFEYSFPNIWYKYIWFSLLLSVSSFFILNNTFSDS